MGLFSRKPKIDPGALVSLRQEFVDLRSRLDASERSKADLEFQLNRLEASAAAMTARSSVIDDVAVRLADVDVLKRQIAYIDVVNARIKSLESLHAKLSELTDRVDASSEDARQAKERTADLDQRISNVSVELANQLGELSHEIDGLASSGASASQPIVADQSVSDEVLDQLRSAQVRLANEQARYEIAFRQDLAMVADQVKRGRHER